MGTPVDGNGPEGRPVGRLGWNAGTVTALAVALFVALTAGRNPQPAGAQSAPRSAAAGPHVYRQTQVQWTSMDDTLTAWEAKGWETFQVVPITNPNPGTGAAMQVAILFRRPAGGGR